jgi:hypothetical protein
MATLSHFVGFLAVAVNLLPLACSKPVGLGGTVTPLQHIYVQTTGDITALVPTDVATDASNLHVALVWGLQWQPEPFCFLPPESPAAAAVIAAGCPDSFGFVPNLVGADASIQPGSPATIALDTLPAANVMVGDLTARIAYGSLVVYDDINDNGTLDLRSPPRYRRRGDPTPTYDDGGPAGARDLVYGASFISMTLPDRRVAYREGGFDKNAAFYPRKDCPDPPLGFSILSAGGFAEVAGGFFQADGGLPLASVGALATGQLPPEDPSTCATATLADTVTIPLQAPANLAQIACTASDIDGTTNYREAPANQPDLTGRQWACAGFPAIPGDDAGVASGQQLVISSAIGEACKYTIHYSLRGCNTDPSCSPPSWDITATPPSWWQTLCPPAP